MLLPGQCLAAADDAVKIVEFNIEGDTLVPSVFWVSVVTSSVLLLLIVSVIYRRITAHIETLTKDLNESNNKLSEAQTIARMGSWNRDFETGESFWTDEALKVFEAQDAEQLKHYEALVHPDDLEQVIEIIAEAYHRGGNYECEHRVITATGEEKYIHLAGQVFLDDEQSGPVREVGTVQDVTDRKKAEERVKQSELKLRSILESAPYPIMIFEPNQLKVLYANKSTYHLFEIPEEKSLSELNDLSGFWIQQGGREEIKRLIAEDDNIRNHETLMKTTRGKVFWALLSASAMDFDGEKALFVSLLDVSEKKLIQEELERLATTDPLTGILNRRSFFEMSNKELRRSVRYSYPFSLLMLDIDYFKRVNDQYGHAFGDEVIKCFTEVCNECLREEDMFGRVGGEEFAVVLVSAEAKGAAIVAERIRKSWQDKELQTEGKLVGFTVSIGVSELFNPRESVEMVLERADKALYDAKQAGRNRVEIYEVEVQEQAQKERH